MRIVILPALRVAEGSAPRAEGSFCLSRPLAPNPHSSTPRTKTTYFLLDKYYYLAIMVLLSAHDLSYCLYRETSGRTSKRFVLAYFFHLCLLASQCSYSRMLLFATAQGTRGTDHEIEHPKRMRVLSEYREAKDLSAFFSIVCVLFRSAYGITPLFATLTKIAGVYLNSSQFGNRRLPLVTPHSPLRTFQLAIRQG